MRTNAFIIKKQPAGEYDQLVTCYTEEFGKLTAVAKSASRPHAVQGMQFDAMNLVSFELIHGRGTPIIAAAQCQNAYANAKRSLPSFAVGCFFMEVLDKIVFGYERDDRLWAFCGDLLSGLDSPAQPVSLDFFRKKQAELLDVFGYRRKEEVLPSGPEYSALDVQFEEVAAGRLASLPFLYSVLGQQKTGVIHL